jgi:hypothetical protein
MHRRSILSGRQKRLEGREAVTEGPHPDFRYEPFDFPTSTVVNRPVSFRGGKGVRARVQVPGRPDTEREDTWEAHQRITMRRD